MEIEEWRLVSEWPDYEINGSGDIRRATNAYFTNPQNGAQCVRVPKGRFLKPALDKDGYLYVTLVRDGIKRRGRIAVLVCEQWHGPRPTRAHQVAHGDGNNKNNRHQNLRWATPRENIEDAINHGTWVRGERNGNSILTVAQVHKIRARLSSGEIARTIALDFGVSKVTI